MRLKDLAINQVPFYYCTYMGEVEEVDDDGYLTGDTVIKYSDPVPAKARISPNTKDAEVMPFGVDLVYDKAISTVQDLPIDEYTKLYIDRVPTYDDNGKLTNEPDYEVVRVAKDLQQRVWAIKRISGEND